MAGGTTPPGWYAAEGDPPNTQRWWDGNQWVGEPQPIPAAPAADPMTSTPPPMPAEPEGSGSSIPDMPLLPGSGAAPQDAVSTPSSTPAPAAMPGAFPGAPSANPATMPGMYPEESRATLALVLSIVGFFVCALPSVAGLVLGWQERSAIDAGRRNPANRGQAVAAIVIGGIVTALLVLFILLIVVLAVVGSTA